MRMNKYLNWIALLSVHCSIFVLSGCSLAPLYERPVVPLPEKFQEAHQQGISIANLPWWDFFQDGNLKSLITTALKENRDLGVSAQRIAESRALVGFIRADQFPKVDLTAHAQRSDAGALIGSAGTFNDYGIFGELSFEVDLWGKLQSATEAQRQELLASEFAYKSITISLVAQVADLYFRLIDLDNRVAIADRTIKNRHDATRLISARFDKGIVPQLDVNQAEIEEYDVAITRTSLVRERAVNEHALRVILGQTSGEIHRSNYLSPSIVKLELPAQVPATLLERRPDLQQSEALVRAEYERVGIARAQQLPTVSLFGFLGLRSSETDDFFSSNGKSWGIGAGLLSPLIDWGKNAARVEAEKARAEQTVLAYEQAVFRSVQEVEDALVGISTFQEEHKYRQLQLNSASNAARLSRARYDDGVAPYLEVLDVERSQFSAELAYSSTFQQYLSSVVLLYKALGGGWEIEQHTAP